MMLTIRRYTNNYRKPLHLQQHVAFLFVVVVVVFFFVAAVDSTSVTAAATDAAAAAVAATATADTLIVDDSLVEHEHEENSKNYAVLRGTSSAVTAGKLSLSNTSNHSVIPPHQRQQHTQKQQSQKEEEEEGNLTPTKFIGVDYQGDPVYMPLIGTGTWQYDITTAYESVCKAFGAGYSFVDTAYGYKNQKGVGRAIKDCWKGNRTDLFVMTKIPGKFLNLSCIRLGFGCVVVAVVVVHPFIHYLSSSPPSSVVHLLSYLYFRFFATNIDTHAAILSFYSFK